MLNEDTKTNEKQKSSFNFYFAFALHVSPLLPLFRHGNKNKKTSLISKYKPIEITLIDRTHFE